ncbi:MAG: P-loop NTPase [Alphaproteobacteria bacterium]|nr:P-loop NTPase [Alphaproteobacteria bacterium]
MNNGLTVSPDAVRAALDTVKDPISGEGLAASGRVSGLNIRPNGAVGFTIEAPAAAVPHYQAVRVAAERVVAALPGVQRATVVLTAQAETARTQPAQGPGRLPGVGAVIAVASAKGGVGKSTVAVNLACAFSALGKRTGLLDLDVYGPSAPTMLATQGQRPRPSDDKKLIPIDAWGLKTLSIGNMVDADQPMVWRGPLASGAARQMLEDADWAPLDVLVLDLPPGTGDLQLTLLQRVALDGAVIVSTPQELALADVRRGIAMFEKTRAPILGVIENMSWLEQPNGERLYVFGEGGARRTAEAVGAPFLGELPIDVRLRESADIGKPLVAAEPDHAMSARFRDIASRILENLAKGQKPAPVIRFV